MRCRVKTCRRALAYGTVCSHCVVRHAAEHMDRDTAYRVAALNGYSQQTVRRWMKEAHERRLRAQMKEALSCIR